MRRRCGIGGMPGERADDDVEPRIERQPSEERVELGGVAGLPEPDIGPAAGYPPQPLELAGGGQLCRPLDLLPDQGVTPLAIRLGRPVDVDLDQELHAPFPCSQAVTCARISLLAGCGAASTSATASSTESLTSLRSRSRSPPAMTRSSLS